MKQRYFIYFSYNGARYCGWQMQPNGISVQEVMQKAISTILRTNIEMTAAGRTDAGVQGKVGGLTAAPSGDSAHGAPDALLALINPGDQSGRLSPLLGKVESRIKLRLGPGGPAAQAQGRAGAEHSSQKLAS